MNKLVKLLNEYHFSWTEFIWYYLDEEENRIYFKTEVVDKWIIDEQRISNERIISKRFGFIKRLVDNDKIDVESYCRITSVERKWEKDVYRDEVDSLLMLLAIQDKSIEFLISILK